MINILETNFQNPKVLIEIISSICDLKETYKCKVRHYSLNDHTLLVLKEFEKYFSKNTFYPFTIYLFRVILTLHDIGKPKAFSIGQKNLQHKFTIDILTSIKDKLELSEVELSFILALLSSDTIGLYMKSNISIEIAISDLVSNANFANLEIITFFKFMTIYYQSDTSSYTADAGGYPYLEYLYEYNGNMKKYDTSRGRLVFSEIYEKRFTSLEKALVQ